MHGNCCLCTQTCMGASCVTHGSTCYYSMIMHGSHGSICMNAHLGHWSYCVHFIYLSADVIVNSQWCMSAHLGHWSYCVHFIYLSSDFIVNAQLQHWTTQECSRIGIFHDIISDVIVNAHYSIGKLKNVLE